MDNDQLDPKVVQEIKTKVSQILTKDEQVQFVAVQDSPTKVNFAPDAVVLTNRRFIIYRPKMLGRVTFEDYIWRDLHDARLKDGMLRSTFMM